MSTTGDLIDSSDLGDWLARKKLGHLKDLFVEAGFTTVRGITGISKEELKKDVKLKSGQAREVLKALEEDQTAPGPPDLSFSSSSSSPYSNSVEQFLERKFYGDKFKDKKYSVRVELKKIHLQTAPDLKEPERPLLSVILESLGAEDVELGGAGHCQFLALADQYYGDPRRFQEIRTGLAAWIQSHEIYYTDLVEGGMDAFYHDLRRDGWGNLLSLHAFSDWKRVPIRVVTSFGGYDVVPRVFGTTSQIRSLPLVVSLCGSHFRSVYFKDDKNLIQIAKERGREAVQKAFRQDSSRDPKEGKKGGGKPKNKEKPRQDQDNPAGILGRIREVLGGRRLTEMELVGLTEYRDSELDRYIASGKEAVERVVSKLSSILHSPSRVFLSSKGVIFEKSPPSDMLGLCKSAVYFGRDKKFGTLVFGKTFAGEDTKKGFREYAIMRELYRVSYSPCLFAPIAYNSIPSRRAENKSVLVMPYLGRPLNLFLESEVLMDEFIIKRVALCVLVTLESLHQLGYAHCDIKPSNIVMAINFKEDYAYLCDYGSATPFDMEIKHGTATYGMSHHNDNPISTCAYDLKCLASTLFYMVTRTIPLSPHSMISALSDSEWIFYPWVAQLLPMLLGSRATAFSLLAWARKGEPTDEFLCSLSPTYEPWVEVLEAFITKDVIKMVRQYYQIVP